jgi:60 kDa SS-A/Ro ribonucleoprotein
MAAAMVRRNPGTRVLAFNQDAVPVTCDPAEPVLALATRLAALADGGTNCSAPLAQLNRERAQGALVLYLSDNESWVDAGLRRAGTAMLDEWQRFKRRNQAARLVCIDLQPSATMQVIERDDAMNVGGFSDQVFEMIAEFAANRLHPDHWVGAIESVSL